MESYFLETNIIDHGKIAENYLCELFSKNHRDRSLISILTIDLSFIDHRAQSSDYIQITDVEYMYSNTYALHYKLDWFIYNGCVNMDGNGTFETTMTFSVFNGYLEFDTIETSRDTINEF